MARRGRDVLTGRWSASIRKRGRRERTRTCIDLDMEGAKPVCETEKSNGIFGDLANIRFNKRGYMKADLLERRQVVAEITVHPGFVTYSGNNPGQTFYDGRLRVDRENDVILMFDDDIQRPWIARTTYFTDL